MPGVDVVVPSYNYARYLPGCVASLFRQEGVDVRVLVIDDASSDDTPDVARRLMSQYPALQFRRHGRNIGHIATYNEGLLGWATADYSLLISADDLLAPGALKRAADILDRRPSVGLVSGIAFLFESDTDLAKGVDAGLPGSGHGPNDQVLSTARFLWQCVYGNPIATPTVVVRTALQHKVGGYAPELPHTGDMEMWMRFTVCADIAVTRFVQAYKRIHASNMSKQYNARALGDLQERLKAFQYAFAQNREHYSQCGLSMDEVRRQIGEQAFWTASHLIDLGEAGTARQCLDFAVETSPAVAHTLARRRLQFKLSLGASLWQRLRPLSDALRSSAKAHSGPTDPRQGPRTGTHQGWWPEPQFATRQLPPGQATS
jgi:Glycosyl transferase family 2